MALSFSRSFDGVTDFQDVQGNWMLWSDDKFLGTVALNGPDDQTFLPSLDIEGSNWAISRLEIGPGTGQSATTNIEEDALASGNLIGDLHIAGDAVVTLDTTIIDTLRTDAGGAHTVTLGSAGADRVYLDGTTNALTTGSGTVANIRTGGADTLNIGGGGAYTVQTGEDNDAVTLGGGTIDFLNTGTGNDSLTVQGGGLVNAMFDFGGDDGVTLRGGSEIGQLQMVGGTNTIVLEDSSRILGLDLRDSVNTVTTASGNIEVINSFGASNTVNIGAGGANQISLRGVGTETQTVTASGWIGNLQVLDGMAATVTLGVEGGGGIRSSGGNDSIGTGTGLVDSIATGNGDDIVTLGTGGAESLRLGAGKDAVTIGDRPADQMLFVRGGAGTDKLSFATATTGVTFTLDRSPMQNPGAPGGNMAADGIGLVFQHGFENLTGTGFNDWLQGDGNDNEIEGLGGNDRLFGESGNDTLTGGAGRDVLKGHGGGDVLNGDGGNDRLFGGGQRDHIDGGTGADMLVGGGGGDVLAGGAGNDTLKGQGGADVFFFGNLGGTDRVLDFNDGVDLIRIEGHTGGFNDLDFHSRHGDLRIDYDGGTIILDDMGGTKLTSADFDFV